MIWTKKGYSSLLFFLGVSFLVIGTYNSIVINSDSHLSSSDLQFVKRLDEIYGVTVHGREVAASVSWQKLNPKQISQLNLKKRFIKQTVQTSNSSQITQQDVVPAAAVQEELSLNLVEVINPRLFAQGLGQDQFTGSLSTNNGVIESLTVSLPNADSLSVSFSEMAGNVFEYDYSGELYSGMMYQVDQNSYMVTLTNGPLEGTRLRFQVDAPMDDTQQIQRPLDENNGETHTFGQVPRQDQMSFQNHNQLQLPAQAQEYVPEPYNPGKLTSEQLSQNDQMMAEQGTSAQFNDPNEQQQM
jgi:hypothetical protein